MTFEEQLVKYGVDAYDDLNEAKLYKYALKASEAPETGVEILVPSAKFVIRDCAKFAYNYIPVFVAQHLISNANLIGKQFTKSQISSLLTRSEKDPATQLLVQLIIDDALQQVRIDPPEPSSRDIYKDFDSIEATPSVRKTKKIKSNADRYELLAKYFTVK